MRNKIIISICLIIFTSGCKKESYNTKPSLTFVNVSSTQLVSGQNLVFTMEFTDAEGDIGDSIMVQKVNINCDKGFIDAYKIPPFPTQKNLKGELTVTFSYNSNPVYPPLTLQCDGQNDSAYFKFVLRDKANNSSDTVTSPLVVIVR